MILTNPNDKYPQKDDPILHADATKAIYIYRGDSTVFADVQKFMTFNIKTEMDLTGWKAEFELENILKEILDISSRTFEVIFRPDETRKLQYGIFYGTLRLYDSNNNVKTISNNIPFKVVDYPVENKHEVITLNIPDSAGVDIDLEVGTGYVTEVNGKSGVVVLTPEDIGAMPADTIIPPEYKLPIASDTVLGGIKVDLNTLKISEDGVLSVLSSEEITPDYLPLENKPQINNIELVGNKTLQELGIQPLGNYLELSDIEEILNGKADVGTIPTKVSQLENDSHFISEIPAEFITEEDLLKKGYATINDIPTKVSQLENDSHFISEIPAEFITEEDLALKGYLTKIPDEYVTEEELAAKGFITIAAVPKNVSAFRNDANYLTSVPDEYVTEEELLAKGYLTKIPDEYVTEEELAAKTFAIKAEIPTNVSQLVNDKNYISSIPDYYVTDQRLASKGYLTAIPEEYVTEIELANKKYARKEDIPTKVSQLINDSKYLINIPEEYVTDTELNLRGYVTDTELNTKGYLTVIPAEYVKRDELGLRKQEMTASDTVVMLDPYKLYTFPVMASLYIDLKKAPTGYASEYHVIFKSGAEATKLTLPPHLKTNKYTIEPNKIYELRIVENICYVTGV